MIPTKCTSYTLKNDSGSWLAQVVITDDGFLGIVSDYGNASFAWRAFGDDFKDFLCRLDCGYFATKLVCGIAYMVHPTKKIDSQFLRMAEHVLPKLQDAIKEHKRLESEATT